MLGTSFTDGEGEAGEAPESVHLGPAGADSPGLEASPVKYVSNEWFSNLLDAHPAGLERLTHKDIENNGQRQLEITEKSVDVDGVFEVPSSFSHYKDGQGSNKEGSSKEAKDRVMERIK